MVLYRKWRPQKFSDLIGQKDIAATLLSQLASGKISHAYLFSGPKGTGKTSTARILAKALNCELYSKKQKFGEPCGKCESCRATTNGSHLDLIEIDAASNRSIDDVREIREKVKLAPVSSRFKIYIVDEAHMMTRDAFNAFLKTLEEPPAHVIFILATTEAEKLLPTILSRVQRFNFKRATDAELAEVCRKIAKGEGIGVDDDAISAIVAASDGSFRDAVSILDQLSSAKKKIDAADVRALSIVSNWEKLFTLVEKFAKKDLPGICRDLEEAWNLGGDISSLGKEVVLFSEKLLLLKIGLSQPSWDLSEEQLSKMRDLASEFSSADLQNLLKLFVMAEADIKIYPLAHIPFVLAAFKYCGEGVYGNFSQEEIADEAVEETKKEKTEEKPVKKAAEVKTSGGGKKVSLGAVGGKWEEFVKKVKGENAHLSAILKSTRPLTFDSDILTLEVFYRFHKQKLEEPKIIALLEKILSEEMKIKVIFKFILAEKESAMPKTVAKSDVMEVASADLESLAAEIFSK